MASVRFNRNIAIWLGLTAFSLVLLGSALTYFRMELVPVLVTDVLPGTEIKADMYRMVEVNPRDGILEAIVKDPSELFRDGDPDSGNGKYTLSAMVTGQPIPRNLVTANPMDPSFGVGAQLQSGEMAVSAAISIAGSVGGAIDVGSVVDLTYVPAASARAAQSSSPQGGSVPQFGMGVPYPDPSMQQQTLDVDAAVTIRGARVLDVRNESGLSRYSSNPDSQSGGRVIVVTFAVPAANATGFSVAMASGGSVSLALPAMTPGGTAPVPGGPGDQQGATAWPGGPEVLEPGQGPEQEPGGPAEER